jgi:DivIVA domain-containing protein
MALDRDSIARRDFPTHRRGYDPEAVNAHLDAIADEVEALRQRAAEPATLSSQAGEQVRAIVQAAERGAEEIREAANVEAREHLARVTEAAERLRGRIEQMQGDVTQVMTDLRTDAERLRNDLAALNVGVGELGAAGTGAAEPPAAASVAPPGADEPTATASAEAPADDDPPGGASVEPPAADEPTAAAPPAPDANGDVAAARIVALDMALSGAPREETDRYLAEHYDVPDRAALLDEVYAAAAS